jgi:purine nucleosidase
VLTTRARTEAIAALPSKATRALAEMLVFFERFDEQKYGSDGAPLHDPCVIAYLLRPELFAGRFCNVEIETASDLTRGMTVVDWWHVTDRAPNATVMREVDAEGFFALLTERLATYS